jgi:hypothetical protein
MEGKSMAAGKGYYVEIDELLDERPRLQQIVDATGCDPLLAVGRLWAFWRWCQRAGKDHAKDVGIIPGVGLDALIRVCSGDESFWRAVAAAGWLTFDAAGILVPGWDERFSQNARRRKLDRERKREQRSRDREQDVTEAPASPQRASGILPSVFAPLTTECLGRPSTMVEWVKAAAAMPRPLVRDDQWHYEHVLAAGIAAINEQGITTPVGWFAWVITTQEWQRIAPKYLTEAKLRLRSMAGALERIAEAREIAVRPVERARRNDPKDQQVELLKRFPSRAG